MANPKDLLALAAKDRAHASKLRAQADLLEKQAGELEAMAERMTVTLTSGPERTKVRDEMELQTERRRKVGRPLDADHPFPEWLKAQNITVTEWAAEHEDPDTGKPYKRERVKSWFSEGSGGRPIPRAAADIIEKEAKLPANKRTWRNGIRE